MHPSEHLKGSKGDNLEGKTIVLGITGSIAAVECVKLIRELVREGAEVHCVMSEWATKIVHPYSMEFSSGHEPITEITGQVEHVSFCGKVPDKADLFLVSPATANTISKIAMGIDDTPVTTFATTCIGSNIPMIVVPAMHQSMYEHPIVMDNLKTLHDELDITIVGPNIEEGAAKVARKDEIVDHVVRELHDDLKGKEITVVTGSSVEPIDSMRVITNKATGKTGIELAKRAFRRGANVQLWYGNIKDDIPSWIPHRRFETLDDLIGYSKDLTDIVIVPAALSDFGVEKVSDSKISSDSSLSLKLEPLPKFIDEIRDDVDFLVAFKAEDSQDKAVDKGEQMIEDGRADMVVANSLGDVKHESNKVCILKGGDWIQGDKRYIADKILDEIDKRA